MSQKNKKLQRKQAAQEAEEKIRELTRENTLLRKEISSLKTEIQQQRASTRRIIKKRDTVKGIFLHQARRENTFSQEAFFSYFRHALKNASLFRGYSQIINTVRHLTFITTTIQVVLFLLTILKSGVIFLISTSAFIVSLPFMILLSGIGAFLTLLGSKKATRINKPILKGKNVCVFFPAKRSMLRQGSYFSGFVSSMSKRPNTVCVVVTQGFFFSRGITGKRKYFFTSRVDADNIIIVRKHYYFKLKNKIIKQYSADLTEIY
ncbi:MAG: hypothetical protein E7642_07205 [Ruminococcaceae bacterium]|nr:hypothetical protein [Oscillospiraceae bacterium]